MARPRPTFKQALFLKSATKPSNWPVLRESTGRELPEIAVAGRSNVGKSSLLNHLLRNRTLARISSTPGKTQLLNFYLIDEQVGLVDLPGYGFAKVPLAKKRQWGEMIQGYLTLRPSLQLLLLLLDIRRIPNAEDCQLLEWIAHNNKSVILVLTKVDKVSKNQRASYTKRILETLPYQGLHYVHYSANKNIGRNELISLISAALAEESEDGDGAAS